jgi:hypothetical protein
MKMISQQAIGERIGDRRDVPDVEREKIIVIARLAKKILAAVAAIIDVIRFAGDERNGLIHRHPDLKGF